MAKTLAELQRENGRLRERIGAQRAALSHHATPLRNLLQVGDQVSNWVHQGADYARQHPMTMASIALLMALLRPRRAIRLVRRGFMAWRTWRTLREWTLLSLRQYLGRSSL